MWKSLDSLPVARHRACAAAFRNFIYVAGGFSDYSQATAVLSVVKSRLGERSQVNSPWSACASPVAAGKGGAQMHITGNGWLMLIGGVGATATSADVDPGQDIWMGKIDSDGNIPKWQKATGALPSSLQDFAVIEHENFLYILGGHSTQVILNFKANTGTGNFTAGQVVTGATSGAVGTIEADSDAGATGTLKLKTITGAFVAGEVITDPLGGNAIVASVLSTLTYLDYDTQTVNFTVGDVVTGGTSAAHGIIAADTDAGATGTLTINTITGTFQAGETITDAHTGSAKATAAQYKTLAYNSQTGNFRVGATVTGGTSAAHARILTVNDAGATGSLILDSVVGTFTNNETITDTYGATAQADQAQGFYRVTQTAILRAKLDAGGGIGGFQTMPSLLPAAMAPEQSVVMVGNRVVVTDDDTMYVSRLSKGGEFGPWVSTALPEIKTGHCALAVGDDDIMIAGGYDGVNVKPSVWTASLDSDGNLCRPWSQQSPLPVEVYQAACCKLGADRVVVLGGSTDGNAVSTQVVVANVNSSGQL